MMFRIFRTACVVFLLLTNPAPARDLFSVLVDVASGGSAARGTNDIRDVIDFIEDGTYSEVNVTYTSTSIATANFDVRGVDVVVSYPTNGSTLIFQVPALGVSETFVGATRADSEAALIDFLERNRNNLLTRLLQLLVATSPADPVAGQPNSLMSKMVAADFDIGTTVGPENSSAPTGQARGDAPSLIKLGARFGHFNASDLDSDVVDLPFRYTVPLADPRWGVTFDFPVTYVETEGAKSYAASFGVAGRLPLLDNWTLTPALRVGGTGSVEAGAAAALYSASLTSNFEFKIADIDVAIGNGATFIQTLPLSFGGYSLDYDLTNYVVRNGISASGDTSFTLFGEPVTWEAAVVNTQFFGTDLYAENTTDVSISFGTKESRNGMTWDSVRVGLTYTFTDADFQGVRLNFGYQF